MDHDPFDIEQRRAGFVNLVHRFSIEYQEALAFLAGWSAYPIGQALLVLLAGR